MLGHCVMSMVGVDVNCDSGVGCGAGLMVAMLPARLLGVGNLGETAVKFQWWLVCYS